MEQTPGRRRPWWAVLAVPDSDVYTVARVLHDLHTLPKASYVRLERLRRQPALSKAALASEESPVSQLVVEGGEGAAVADAGVNASGRVNGVASEGVSAGLARGASGSREASHTGERRPRSNDDSGGGAEVCYLYLSLVLLQIVSYH